MTKNGAGLAEEASLTTPLNYGTSRGLILHEQTAMDNTFDKTAIETIELLEARLQRIEYAVGGQADKAANSRGDVSAAKRLVALEHSLHQLASKSRTVQDLLRLRQSSVVAKFVICSLSIYRFKTSRPFPIH